MCPQLRSIFRSMFSRIVDPFLTMPVDPGISRDRGKARVDSTDPR